MDRRTYKCSPPQHVSPCELIPAKTTTFYRTDTISHWGSFVLGGVKNLSTKYHSFIIDNDLSKKQELILKGSIGQLTQLLSGPDNYTENQINITKAVQDNDVILYRKSSVGIFNIVIDDDGDVMLSESPYKGKGWRKFIDFDDFSPFKAASSLLK